MTAIVASGYLFAEEQAYHVDVYQGDTPTGLLERHAPGVHVKRAAVLDIDVPGQTIPLEIEADEPVVVVGASPRTSVFVYGEAPRVSPDVVAMQNGEVVAATAAAPKEEPTPPPPPLAEPEVEAAPQIEAKPESEPGPTETATNEPPTKRKEAVPTDVTRDERFARTRRLRKPKAERGTRRAPRVIEIELT
jgi:hypothetical protein